MNNLSNNTDNILSNFPSCLRKNIEELCLRSTIGLFPIHLDDISIVGNKALSEDGLDNFHYIFKIPYAGKELKWEVMFDPEDFHFPPDFEFNNDEFLSYPDIESISDFLPSWKNWNINNPKALAQVLDELLTLYKKQQVEKLHLENIYSRYSEEYKSLIDDKDGVGPENVQVRVDGNNIGFLIAIKLDWSPLTEYIDIGPCKENNNNNGLFIESRNFCHLKVLIPKLDGSQSTYSIKLPPKLEQILGNFKFTGIDLKRDTPLKEVVSSVTRIIENRLEEIINHWKLKQIYILNLVGSCAKNIIEYDMISFKKAVFIYSKDDYNCLVTVSIGSKFPQEKPLVTLSSLYCVEMKACNFKVNKYPYFSDQTPESNIKHLLEYLHNTIEEFKGHKH